MKPFLFLFLLVSSVSCLSQNKIKVVIERFENGNPKLVRYFDLAKDTSLKIQVDNRIGRRILNIPISIITETYFENGQLEYRGEYKKGLATGLFEFYYDNGVQLARSYYKNGRICDSLICYYPSGKLKRIVIETDKLKNLWHNIDYYESGIKSVECYQTQQIDKIILNGKYREWYENGQKAFEATLKNNLTLGIWNRWDEKGQLLEHSSSSFRIPSIGED